jgi:hypothetical protein
VTRSTTFCLNMIHLMITSAGAPFKMQNQEVVILFAGSERQKSVESEGERLKEATSINRSLSALGLVVRKLVAGEAHIPYRDSRLTFLMQARP